MAGCLVPAPHLSFWLGLRCWRKTSCVELAQGDQHHGQRSGRRGDPPLEITAKELAAGGKMHCSGGVLLGLFAL